MPAPFLRRLRTLSTRSSHRTYQVFAFVGLTYVLAWTCWLSAPHVRWSVEWKFYAYRSGISGSGLLLIIGNLVPGLTALLLASVGSEPNTLTDLRVRLTSWPIALAPYVWACLFPVVYCVPTALTLRYLFGQATHTELSAQSWIGFVYNLPLAPLWEEIGWRGYLLPRLAQKNSALLSSIKLGLIWGPWHLPLLLLAIRPGMALLDVMIVFSTLTIGLSILFTWLVNRSRGSLIPAVLLHGLHNFGVSFFSPSSVTAGGWSPLLMLTLFVWTTALVVLMVDRSVAVGNPTPDQSAS